MGFNFLADVEEHSLITSHVQSLPLMFPGVTRCQGKRWTVLIYLPFARIPGHTAKTQKAPKWETKCYILGTKGETPG